METYRNKNNFPCNFTVIAREEINIIVLPQSVNDSMEKWSGGGESEPKIDGANPLLYRKQRVSERNSLSNIAAMANIIRIYEDQTIDNEKVNLRLTDDERLTLQEFFVDLEKDSSAVDAMNKLRIFVSRPVVRASGKFIVMQHQRNNAFPPFRTTKEADGKWYGIRDLIEVMDTRIRPTVYFKRDSV